MPGTPLAPQMQEWIVDPIENRRVLLPDVGLCAVCKHARVIRSARGSTFYQCQLWFSDPEYPKYPRLPKLACDGHEPGLEPPAGS